MDNERIGPSGSFDATRFIQGGRRSFSSHENKEGIDSDEVVASLVISKSFVVDWRPARIRDGWSQASLLNATHYIQLFVRQRINSIAPMI